MWLLTYMSTWYISMDSYMIMCCTLDPVVETRAASWSSAKQVLLHLPMTCISRTDVNAFERLCIEFCVHAFVQT